MEDLKERYYSVCNRLVKARSGDESQMVAYDAPHEVKRKMQVRMLCECEVELIGDCDCVIV